MCDRHVQLSSDFRLLYVNNQFAVPLGKALSDTVVENGNDNTQQTDEVCFHLIHIHILFFFCTRVSMCPFSI